ncbi:MAG: NAD(P)-dependent oxidoreductase [Rhodoferax sp.]|uniref:NAD(P)-dependent oxidoreductase n=1 Tax=Rhodoferax sp. TaxID=50421 RepID=UPI002632BB27|nr:NAD(P)-dependent oxidoreductase [Rhodoferax sp.]MDD2880155.1 NAD(P)-dependent oxidoreductase [Rhodoferax sp.]
MTLAAAAGPVAIIGVGNMGGAMARRLLSQGWSVRVCDIDRAKTETLEHFGALALVTPAQAAIHSVVIMVVVVDAAQTEDVLFGPSGAASVLQPGQTVLLCPTLAPADVTRLAQRLQTLGVAVLDAPMSGGPQRAQEGSMSLMLAGDSAVLARHQTLLEALASQRFVISERVGDAARTKLVNNLAAGINLVGAAEVLALAQKMGLDLTRTLDVIEQSSGQSWIGSDRMRRAIAGDFAPRAHMTLLQKDTRLALDAAQSVGFYGPLGAAARDVFAQASAGGMADQDDAALFKWLSAGTGSPN